jgi:cellulose synthase/poly-beta-1,6-N-acetylglucosamine synthase-like glycosyltransferase
VLLIFYYFYGWIRLEYYEPLSKNLSTRISVILPVRNEEKNIKNILADLCEQTYPKHLYEIIIIDDHSSDATKTEIHKANAENIRYLNLENHSDTGKKAAIQLGIHHATGELIITTDADCRMGNNWLHTYACYYEERKPVMIAGMVNYFYDPTILGKFQTLDFLSMVGIAAASIRNGFYNLCNGANLAYTRNAFYAVDGFMNNTHIPSGDDMMLMHKIAGTFPGKVAYLKNRDAIVYTQTEKDFFSFWNQRLRWASKSTHYEDQRITCILILVYLFNASIVINLVAGFFDSSFLRIAMFQFVIKICVDTVFTYVVSKFFRRENLLWLFLPMQTLHIIYILLIAPAAIFGKYEWKQREIKRATKIHDMRP